MNHIPRRLQSCSELSGWWRATGGCGRMRCARDPGRARGVSQGPPKLLARHTRHFYNQEKYMWSLNPASKHARAAGLDTQASEWHSTRPGLHFGHGPRGGPVHSRSSGSLLADGPTARQHPTQATWCPGSCPGQPPETAHTCRAHGRE